MSDSIIVGVLTAVIAVIALIVNTNHDRKQKSLERSFALRRDIYLGLAQHLQESLFAIVDFADLTQDHKAVVKTFRSSAHFAAKLNLMAKGELLDAFSIASTEISASFAQVFARRAALVEGQRALARFTDQITAHRAARDRATEALRQRHLDGLLTQPDQERLNRVAEAENKEAERIASLHDASLADHRPKTRDLFRYALTEQSRLYPLLLNVVKAARHELREDIDMAVYQRVIQRAEEQTKKTVATLLTPVPPPSPAPDPILNLGT